MSSTSKPESSLSKISSLRELKRERARLKAEQEFAAKAIGNNFALEKAALKQKFTATQESVQGIAADVSGIGNVFKSLKWPALGGLAAVIGFLFTSWLSGWHSNDDDGKTAEPPTDTEEDQQRTKNDKSPHNSDAQAAAFSNEQSNRQQDDQERTLEERIKAALADYENEKQQETAEPSPFLIVLRIIGPIIARELLQGDWLASFTQSSNTPEMDAQSFGDSIADELESVKEELVKQGS